MLTVIGSMEYELAGVRKGLPEVGSCVPGGQIVREGEMLELLVTGVGRECTEASVGSLLARKEPSLGEQSHAPRRVLQLGFAGAVNPVLCTGDLVLSSRYYPAEPQAKHESRPTSAVQFDSSYANVRDHEEYLTPDPAMWRQAVAAAEEMGQQVAYADSLTVDRLVTSRTLKQKISEEYRVGIVNMEDYWAGLAARAAGVAYLSIRVVLDTANQSLPGYLPGLAGSPLRAALLTAAKPWRIPKLMGLAGQMTSAQKVLSRFALTLLEKLFSEAQDPQCPRQPGSGVPSSACSRVTA